MKYTLLITTLILCTYTYAADNRKKQGLEFFSTLKPVVIDRDIFETAQKEAYDKLYSKNIETPGKTLIIDSIRASKSSESNFANAVWHCTDTDFSFTGKDDYITMDVNPAENPGQHIIGDATMYKVNEKNIRTLYFQSPWTYRAIANGASENDYLANVIAQSIRNLLPKLRSGGQVLIEWHPFCVITPYYDDSPSATYDDILEETDRKKNPFTAFFDINVCKAATLYATQVQFTENAFPPHCLLRAKKLSPTVSNLLDFYAKQTICYGNTKNPISRADLDNQLITEIQTIAQMGEELSPQEQAYFSETVFDFLWADMGARTNALYAIRCLQKIGLKNVRFWRGESPINGLKNVWLLSGFKK